MRLLLAVVMLSVLAGCVVYDEGYYRHRGDGGWNSQGDDDGGHRHRHHRGDQDDQGEDD